MRISVLMHKTAQNQCFISRAKVYAVESDWLILARQIQPRWPVQLKLQSHKNGRNYQSVTLCLIIKIFLSHFRNFAQTRKSWLKNFSRIKFYNFDYNGQQLLKIQNENLNHVGGI